MAVPSLFTTDPEIRDLDRGAPPLVDADSGHPTGARLVRHLGTGGMSTVYLAELDRSARSDSLSEDAPPRLAVKFLKPALLDDAAKINVDPATFFLKEVVALGKMMAREIPTEYVVEFYGCGHSLVQLHHRTLTLPWLAIEYVDGGTHGVTLTDRVLRAGRGGVDPVRALRLATAMIEGVCTLHEERVIHRDLKPDNVLVAGPVDDEVPKLADCGIARVEGVVTAVAAATPTYGGPEQFLSRPPERNPLVGPWTDVHALAAVLWFLLGGESWCRGVADEDWHRGARRSLRTASAVHDALLRDPALLDRIDAVLARGAAQRLPAEAIREAERTGLADDYLHAAHLRFPSVFSGVERFVGARELGDALLPLLRQLESEWKKRCATGNMPSTELRSTELPADSGVESVQIQIVSRRAEIEKVVRSGAPYLIAPGAAVSLPEGKALAKLGDRLFYLNGDHAHQVAIHARYQPLVTECRWVTRGPQGSYALVGPSSVLLISSTRRTKMAPPRRPSGGEVGPICGAVGSVDVFGVVTSETEDSHGGAELWTSSDGLTWSPPVVVPLGGDVHGVCHGPHGYVFVGARRGSRGRALHLPFDHQPVIFVAGVNEGPPLALVVWGAGREAWAAGTGQVLCLQRGSVTSELVEAADRPVALGLDFQSTPWLVTESSISRRDMVRGTAMWQIRHRRPAGAPPFVAAGFTKDEVHVLDARGDTVILRLTRGPR
jgi:eukaryotic-like serine/threonine-protein kinase